MITTGRVNYVFEFCRGSSYASFVNGVNNHITFTRLCYLGVESLRVYLNLVEGQPRMDFFERSGCVWNRISHPPRYRPLDVSRMLHSSQGFESELAESFFHAYPGAEESYYRNMPDHREVISILNSNPTESGAKEHKLLCYCEDGTTADEADGIITILCEDGKVCAPYTVAHGDKVLQMDRALFHADSKFVAASEGFFDKCFKIKSKLQSLTLSGVLSKIERLMP